MAEDRNTREESPMSEMERLRLKTLADKRNESLNTMSNTVRKEQESRRDIIDKMR